jgi:hypothetical protein
MVGREGADWHAASGIIRKKKKAADTATGIRRIILPEPGCGLPFSIPRL